MKISPCPNCSGSNLYRSKPISGGGGYAPNYLTGLGGFWRAEYFHLVMCRDCGLTRFFARPEASTRLADSKDWERVQS